MTHEDNILQRYNDPSAPGSFQGPEKLFVSAKRDGANNLKRNDVNRFLQKENTYTLNRAVQRKFPRNRVVVAGFDSQWDMDLADLSLLYKENDGYKYFLLAIDIFSRYVWVRPVKTKYAKEIVKVITSIFAEGRKPRTIRTDGGKEFQNQTVKAFLSEQGVHIFSTYNEVQANYAERAIKTIKSKLYRYLISRNTLRYIDVLQDLVKSYNNTVHSSLGRPPSKVTKQNESEVRLDQYMKRRKPKNDWDSKFQLMKYKVGDQVRITYRRKAFDREYDQKFSGEVFVVSEARRRNTIPIYKLKDWNGEPIKGTFYQQQLQKVDVSADDSFKIEKIIKRRRRNGRNQVLVKWQHWPRSFNQWLDEDAITEL